MTTLYLCDRKNWDRLGAEDGKQHLAPFVSQQEKVL